MAETTHRYWLCVRQSEYLVKSCDLLKQGIQNIFNENFYDYIFNPHGSFGVGPETG